MTEAYLRTKGLEVRPDLVAVPDAPVPEKAAAPDHRTKAVANENAASIAALIGQVPGGGKRVRG